MTTAKELADAYRLVADDRNDARRSGQRLWPTEHIESLHDRADELDPPKPTYPDGMYAIVTFEQRFDERVLASYARRAGDEWVTADGRKVCDDDDVTKVEPLRVLGDDEIALPKIDLDTGALRDLVRCHEHRSDSLPRMSINARDVVWHYAAALDAESGDRS